MYIFFPDLSVIGLLQKLGHEGQADDERVHDRSLVDDPFGAALARRSGLGGRGLLSRLALVVVAVADL